MTYRILSFALLVPALSLATGCPDSLLAPAAAITFVGDAPAPVDGGVADGGSAPAPDACSVVNAPISGRIGEAVAITGICSGDPQGLALRYDWAVIDSPAGSLATLADASRVTPSFAPDMPGSYRLRLLVSNGTLTSDPVEVEIEVDDCGIRAPEATPSATPMAPAVGQTVQLMSSISDADTEAACAAHAPVYSYAWSFAALPAGSGATLNDASVQDPSFTPDVPGVYTLRLVATDPTGRSSASTLDVTANTCGTNAPTATAAAAPTSTHPGEGVQLQGAGSDADNDAGCGLGQRLSYDWQFVELPAGSLARIVSPTAERASFVPDVPGDYVAALVVTDDTGLRSDATPVTVTADVCGLAEPIAAAAKLAPDGRVDCMDGTTPTVDLRTTLNEVQFDATGSTDPDNGGACSMNQTLFYDWRVMSTPLLDGRAGFRNPSARQPVLDVQENGRYEIRLIVTDETGRPSRPVTCRVDVTNVN